MRLRPDQAVPVRGEATSLCVSKGTQPLERIGDYLIEGKIAQGGMGIVYRAKQSKLGRTVALKVMLGAEHASSEDLQRFRREAQSAARLRHPHIVAIHDSGLDGGRPWFTMDYVAGRPLSQALEIERITPRRAAQLAYKLSLALHYAHGEGVIHRDIKPANVLMDEAGEPHLTDFGLAKSLAGDDRLTLTGTAMGTPAYMPPEQARGDLSAIGPASDVYALGATLYEMLTLKPPFSGGSVGEIMKRVLHDDPVPPRRLAPETPRDLEVIALKALEKEPQRRYATAGDLARDLGHWLDGEPIEARPQSPWSKAWRKLRQNRPLLGVLVLAWAGAAGGMVYVDHLRATQARREEAHQAFQRVGGLGVGASSLDLLREAQGLYDRVLAIDGAFPAGRYYRGRTRLRLGDFVGAIDDLERVAADPALGAEAPFYLGLSRLRRLKREILLTPPADREERRREIFALAGADFARAQAAGPDSAHGLVGDAYLLLMARGPVPRALELLAAAESRDAKLPEIYYLRAAIRSNFDLGLVEVEDREGTWVHEVAKAPFVDLAQAERDIAYFLARDPVDPTPRLVQAWVALLRRRHAEALEHLGSYLDVNPPDFDVRMLRYRILMGLERHDEAIADARVLVAESPQWAEVHLRLAALLLFQERYDEVEEAMTSQLTSGGHGSDERLRLRAMRGFARVCQEDYAGAKEDLEEVVAEARRRMDLDPGMADILAPGNPLLRVLVDVLPDMGHVFTLSPERKAAVRELESLKDRYPGLRFVVDQERSKDFDLDRALFMEALERPGREGVREALRRYGEQTGHTHAALAFLEVMRFLALLQRERALLAHQDLASGRDYLERAVAHYRARRWAEAEDDLHRAVRLEREDPEIRWALATLRAIRAKTEPARLPGALRALRRAVLAGWPQVEYALRDPDFSALRQQPEFERILELAR